jgi:hypothetical protein
MKKKVVENIIDRFDRLSIEYVHEYVADNGTFDSISVEDRDSTSIKVVKVYIDLYDVIIDITTRLKKDEIAEIEKQLWDNVAY